MRKYIGRGEMSREKGSEKGSDQLAVIRKEEGRKKKAIRKGKNRKK
jgi:hypothetical protein